LRSLTLDNVPGIEFDALTALPHLTRLGLKDMAYSGIHVLPNLEVLGLGDTEVELTELRSLPKLRSLVLDAVPELDLSLLASLPQLKKLALVNMPWGDLTPFQARPDIEIIRS
jgi:Leucine-rich repeat (LRR) protein